MQVETIIPALNEDGNIAALVRETLAQAVCRVIVVDNGSTDDTAGQAREAGAHVVTEPRRGYGSACAAGVAALLPDTEAVVFLDGDFSMMPDEMPRLVAPILAGQADLVLGSRTLGHILPGAMTPTQRFGNWLTAALIYPLYGLRLTDLSPYRAVRCDLLRRLNMQEMTYGWPTEMIVKAARGGARVVEVPVSFHPRRAGESKVSGTVRGTLLAGQRILAVTFRYSFVRER